MNNSQGVDQSALIEARMNLGKRYLGTNKVKPNYVKLGMHHISTLKKVMYVGLKVLSLFTIIFAPFVFSHINRKLTEIAHRTIDEDNQAYLRDKFKEHEFSEETVNSLYMNKLISVGEYLTPQNLVRIEESISSKKSTLPTDQNPEETKKDSASKKSEDKVLNLSPLAEKNSRTVDQSGSKVVEGGAAKGSQSTGESNNAEIKDKHSVCSSSEPPKKSKISVRKSDKKKHHPAAKMKSQIQTKMEDSKKDILRIQQQINVFNADIQKLNRKKEKYEIQIAQFLKSSPDIKLAVEKTELDKTERELVALFVKDREKKSLTFDDKDEIRKKLFVVRQRSNILKNEMKKEENKVEVETFIDLQQRAQKITKRLNKVIDARAVLIKTLTKLQGELDQFKERLKEITTTKTRRKRVKSKVPQSQEIITPTGLREEKVTITTPIRASPKIKLSKFDLLKKIPASVLNAMRNVGASVKKAAKTSAQKTAAVAQSNWNFLSKLMNKVPFEGI